MKTKENILQTHGINVQTAAKTAAELIAGIFFSCSGAGGMFPFGIAYSASTGIFGMIGVIIGYLFNGGDIFRYCTASVVNFAARKILLKKVPLKKEYAVIFFTLWAVLTSAAAGLFIVKADFTENCLFLICGPVSAIFSFIFSVVYSSFSGEKQLTAPIRFIFTCIFFSALLPGFLSMGSILKSAALSLIFIVLFCISGKCVVYVSATAAAIASVTLFICDTSAAHLIFTLVFGAIGAGLMQSLGKFPVILAYTASAAFSALIFGSKNFFPILICIVFSGTVYAALPLKAEKAITGFIVSDLRSPKKAVIKKKNKIRRSMPEKTETICGKCKRKYICWIKEYGAMNEAFEKIRKTGEIPDYFRENCKKSDEIIRSITPSIHKKLKESHASVSLPKTGETVCGDTCTAFSASDGKMIYCIADGMGTGENAGRESIRISVMIKKLMSQGLDKNDALRLANDALLRSDHETVMGIDIAVLDMVKGVCEFVKTGASPSYVVRDGDVYEVGSSSVPIGMLENVNVNKTKCIIEDGDIIIMTSDGFSGCPPKIISSAVEEASDPLSLAKKLISHAQKSHLAEHDDISVMVIFVDNI